MALHIAMIVPVAVVDQFDDADVSLDQPVRGQALPGERSAVGRLDAVQFQRLARLASDIENLRRHVHHPLSHVVRVGAGDQPRVVRPQLLVPPSCRTEKPSPQLVCQSGEI